MHWVTATLHDTDRTVYLNLDAIPEMVRSKNDESEVTIVFLGGATTTSDGEVAYARTFVKETPEELLAKDTVKPKPRVRVSANGKQLVGPPLDLMYG